MRPDRSDGDTHRVHPRWVWGGIAAAVVGLVTLGAGIMLLSVAVAIAGSVVLVAGGAASLLGGAMYDAGHGADAGDELEQVREGDVHEGTYPGEMVEDEDARRDAAETSREVRRRVEAGPVSRPPVAPAAGWFLFAIASFVVLSQPWFIDNSALGRDTALRDCGLAIVVGLAGVWMANVAGRHRVLLLIATAAGLGFVAAGLFAEHAYARTAGLETVVGVLVAGASVAALLRQSPVLTARRRRGRPARSPRA